MSDRSSFEGRLEVALREYADQAVMPFDPDVVAERAISSPAAANRWPRRALAAVAGVAAVLILVVVSAQFIAGPLGIGSEPVIEAGDVPGIVADGSNTPGEWNVSIDDRGFASLRAPMRSSRTGPVAGFVDGRTVEMCRVGPSGEDVDCMLTWAALYDSDEAAEDAMAAIVDEFESPDSWRIPQGSGESVGDLGDDALLFRGVQDPTGPPLTAIFLWREGTLLMAASGVDGMPIDRIRAIADQMQERAANPS
jgi:hypothetical protein